MKNVLVIDPGYSLKNAMESYKRGDFPGSVLYGVNHFKENGWNPVFEDSVNGVKELSLGASYINVLVSRIKCELLHLCELIRIRKKNIDVIYLPLVNFGLSVVLAKKIFHIPIVGVIHSAYYSGIKRSVYKKLFKNLDRIVFLSSASRSSFDEEFGEFGRKAYVIQLMPEVEKVKPRKFSDRYKYDICMIGKTYRDFKTYAKVVDKSNINAVLVGGV